MLLMDWSLPQLGLLALVIVLIGISKAGFAGGLGVLATPLLLTLFAPRQALALLLPVLMITDLFTLQRYWQQWRWDLLKPLWPGAIAGVLVGGLLLGKLDEQGLRFGIGFFASLFACRALWLIWQSRRNQETLTERALPGWISAILAFVAGSSSTLVHAGGPPITMYLTLKQIAATAFIASSAVFFALLNWSKVPVYLANDLFSLELVGTALLLSPLCWLGTWLGMRVRALLQEQLFAIAVQLLLLLTGLRLLYLGS